MLPRKIIGIGLKKKGARKHTFLFYRSDEGCSQILLQQYLRLSCTQIMRMYQYSSYIKYTVSRDSCITDGEKTSLCACSINHWMCSVTTHSRKTTLMFRHAMFTKHKPSQICRNGNKSNTYSLYTCKERDKFVLAGYPLACF